jgi:hypothetical protein
MGKITWNSKPMHQQQHQQHKHLQGAVDKPNQPKLPAHRRIVFNLSPKFPKAYSHDSPNFTSCPYSIVSPWSSVSSCSSLSPRMSEISGLNSSDSDNSNNSTPRSMTPSSSTATELVEIYYECSKYTDTEISFQFFKENDEYDEKVHRIREDWSENKSKEKRIKYCLSPAIVVGHKEVVYEKANVIIY